MIPVEGDASLARSGSVAPGLRGRLVLLHKYGPAAASFRHRVAQYIPYLEAAGITCRVDSLLDDGYLVERLRTGRRRKLPVAAAIIRRIGVLAAIRRYDAALIGVDLFPYFPALFERLIDRLGVPFAYDLDDAVFHLYDQSKSPIVRALLSGKVREIARRADVVLAGNTYVAEYAALVNPRVEIFPTVVDLGRYSRPREFDQATYRGQFTIGWIGSPSTAQYLHLVCPALRQLAGKSGVRVIVVGSGPISLPGVEVEIRDWSEATEIADIMDFDVGIMPLDDTPWSRGKSGFKLIQYMACGVPVVASPVGVNSVIVDHGQNGFLAVDHADWVSALNTLRDDRGLAARMGAAGRRKVEAHYSLQVTGPRFAACMVDMIQRHRQPA